MSLAHLIYTERYTTGNPKNQITKHHPISQLAAVFSNYDTIINVVVSAARCVEVVPRVLNSHLRASMTSADELPGVTRVGHRQTALFRRTSMRTSFEGEKDCESHKGSHKGNN
jgi:hypothetical protein